MPSRNLLSVQYAKIGRICYPRRRLWETPLWYNRRPRESGDPGQAPQIPGFPLTQEWRKKSGEGWHALVTWLDGGPSASWAPRIGSMLGRGGVRWSN